MPTLVATHGPDRLVIWRTGQRTPLCVQHAAPGRRPFIHPLLAPDGAGELTEDSPAHHPWQHGLYVGLNDVNGVGFWMEGHGAHSDRDGTFLPEPISPPTVGSNQAAWNVSAQWFSPSGALLLRETQSWRLEDRGASWALDVVWTLQAAVDLRFGKHAYGGLFLRMPWREGQPTQLLTSEGARTPAEADGRRARWVALAMPLPGRTKGPAGLAFLDHKGNSFAPSPWRVDDQFGVAPSRSILGEWSLQRGASTSQTYRLLAFCGDIAPAAVEAEWRGFSDLPFHST